MHAAPSPASPNSVPPRTAEVHALTGSTPPGASQPFAVVTEGASPAGAPISATVADVERRLAAAGVPLGRLLLEANVARSTWARWRAGGTPRLDRWAAALAALDVLAPVPAPAVADAPPVAPEADREDWRSRLVPLIRRGDRVSRAVCNAPLDSPRGIDGPRGKLWGRMSRRVQRWAERLGREQAQDARAAAFKAGVLLDLAAAGWNGEKRWSDPFALSVARDAVRLGRGAAGAEPAGEMARLVSSWSVLAAELDVAEAAREDAVDRFTASAPLVPEALFWRDGDARLVGPFPAKEYETGRSWYGQPSTIAAIQSMADIGVGAERRREILQANDGWLTEREVVRQASGLADAEEPWWAVVKANVEQRAAIFSTPARTVQDVLLKAKVVAHCYGGPAGIAQEMDDERSDGEGRGTGEMGLLSLLMDLSRMVASTVEGERSPDLPASASSPEPAVAVGFAWVA